MVFEKRKTKINLEKREKKNDVGIQEEEQVQGHTRIRTYTQKRKKNRKNEWWVHKKEIQKNKKTNVFESIESVVMDVGMVGGPKCENDAFLLAKRGNVFIISGSGVLFAAAVHIELGRRIERFFRAFP